MRIDRSNRQLEYLVIVLEDRESDSALIEFALS